jgi:hypothetical protein
VGFQLNGSVHDSEDWHLSVPKNITKLGLKLDFLLDLVDPVVSLQLRGSIHGLRQLELSLRRRSFTGDLAMDLVWSFL